MKSVFLALIFLISFSNNTIAQEKLQETDLIKVGAKCPDFEFSEIHYYRNEQVRLQDLIGKPLILDFWNMYCHACLESFPKVNKINKEFGDSLNIILVGQDDAKWNHQHIREVYEKFRQKWSLNLPVAYDTIFWNKAGITSLPFILWIDKKGIIQAITNSSELNSSNVQKLIRNERLSLILNRQTKQDIQFKQIFDYEKPLLINGNGGEDSIFLFRSILTKWSIEKQGVTAQQDYIGSLYGNRVQLIGRPLKDLYKIAYGDTLPYSIDYAIGSCYGKYWREPILEVSDSSDFLWTNTSEKNLYSYSLIVPMEKANPNFIKEVMQRDLKSYFGYSVTVENRLMPYWRITATKNPMVRLKTNESHTIEEKGNGVTHISFKRIPIQRLVYFLFINNQFEPPFIDDTGINYDIDLILDLDITQFSDLNAIKRALRKEGLDLVKSQKEMKVVVVRDKGTR